MTTIMVQIDQKTHYHDIQLEMKKHKIWTEDLSDMSAWT